MSNSHFHYSPTDDLFKNLNFKSCDATQRVVRKVKCHTLDLGGDISPVSHGTLRLYSTSIHLPAAILI